MELREYAKDIQIILVGNKSDLPLNKHEVSIDEAKDLANKYGAKYLSASALEDKNINEIFSTLAVEIFHYQMKKEKEVSTKRKKIIKLNSSEDNRDDGCC